MTAVDPPPFAASDPDEGDRELLVGAEPVARSQWQLFRRRFFRHKPAMIGLGVLVILYVGCFGASWIAPYPKNQQDLLLGPVGPSAEHWFGTDELGRDNLTELLYAGQVTLLISLSVAVLSTVLGVALGAVAGFYGRATDQLLMRVTDLFLVVPSIVILAIALQAFGQEPPYIVLVLSSIGWMVIGRVVRSQVLSLREKEFVEAARASGASGPRIIVRHIVPNLVGSIVVNVTVGVALAVVAESTLSFLGFGVRRPDTSWGVMLADARSTPGTDKAHLLYFPALALILVVLAVNFLGDGLRDASDPQSKK
jgi:peptide/nickel transport system permease protein